MPFVVTENCIKCKYTDCVEVCPVDCFHEGPNFLATRLPDLQAAVPFYGSGAPLADVGKIKAELLVVLASDDERVNAGWPAYEEALKAAGVTYRMSQPPDTQHGFHNDTTPRFDPAGAALAWGEAVAFLKAKLGA